MRTGGPIDEHDDLHLPVWAGHVPLRLVPGEPVQDPAQGSAGRSAPERLQPAGDLAAPDRASLMR